jgi:hypothetical protein
MPRRHAEQLNHQYRRMCLEGGGAYRVTVVTHANIMFWTLRSAMGDPAAVQVMQVFARTISTQRLPCLFCATGLTPMQHDKIAAAIVIAGANDGARHVVCHPCAEANGGTDTVITDAMIKFYHENYGVPDLRILNVHPMSGRA